MDLSSIYRSRLNLAGQVATVVAGVAAYWALVQAERTIEDCL
jgi:hypothetical protein